MRYILISIGCLYFIFWPPLGRKIFQAFEIILTQTFILNVVLWINICQVLIFRLHTVYNKHDVVKIGIQIREKSQVLEYFHYRLYLLPFLKASTTTVENILIICDFCSFHIEAQVIYNMFFVWFACMYIHFHHHYI